MYARTRKQSLRSEAAGKLSLALPERAAGAASLLKNGQRVSLYVRSVSGDGTARIQVAGADITAKSEMRQGSFLQAGQVLKGRVFFEDGKVYIRLAQPNAPAATSFSRLLASNGIAQSEAAYRALSLFYASGMRMEPSLIRQALIAAAAFPGNEARAAETAALLLQKGLPLSEESLKSALAIIEGKALQGDAFGAEDAPLTVNPDGQGGRNPESASGGKMGDEGDDGGQGGQSESAKDAGEFFRAFTGQDADEGPCPKPAWFIVPFKGDFGGMDCTGSIRFLAGGLGGKALETRITIASSATERAGGFSADFVLSESGCRFALSPQPQGRQAERLGGELSKMLKSAGLVAVVEYGLSAALAQVKSVDMEI